MIKYNDLDVNNKAPANGQLLAYTRTQVLFEKYENLDKVKELINDQELLELHLFDKDKEYRAVATREKRKFDNCKNGIIEYVSDFVNKEEIYSETILLENKYKGYGSIKVLNHIQYDDEKSGMAEFDDYRLVMEG